MRYLIRVRSTPRAVQYPRALHCPHQGLSRGASTMKQAVPPDMCFRHVVFPDSGGGFRRAPNAIAAVRQDEATGAEAPRPRHHGPAPCSPEGESFLRLDLRPGRSDLPPLQDQGNSPAACPRVCVRSVRQTFGTPARSSCASLHGVGRGRDAAGDRGDVVLPGRGGVRAAAGGRPAGPARPEVQGVGTERGWKLHRAATAGVECGVLGRCELYSVAMLLAEWGRGSGQG